MHALLSMLIISSSQNDEPGSFSSVSLELARALFVGGIGGILSLKIVDEHFKVPNSTLLVLTVTHACRLHQIISLE